MESIWTIRQVRIKPEKLLYILFIENKRLSPIIFSFKVPLWLGPEYWDIFDSEQFAGNSNLTIVVLTMLSYFFELTFFCYFQVLNVFLKIALNLYKFSLNCFDFV